MSEQEPPVEMDVEEREGLRFFWGCPMLVHCNHFNRSHQMFIEDPDYVDSEAILLRSAAESSYKQTKNYLESLDDSTWDDVVTFAQFVFSMSGFGKMDLTNIDSDGGVVNQPHSHYGQVLQLNPGTREDPGEYFDRGFLAGVLLAGSEFTEMPYDEESVTISQTKSIVLGDDKNQFEVSPGGDFQWLEMLDPINGYYEYNQEYPPVNKDQYTVDFDTVVERVHDMEMHGNEQGLINAFGLTLTNGYLDFYMKSIGRFLNEVEEQFGTPEIADDLVREIGHYCGFFMAGKMMQSPEFEALAGGNLETKEDYFWTLIAALNSMGWGNFRISEFEPGKKMQGDQYNWFEGAGHMTWFGEYGQNVEYMSEGGAGAAMNLLYYADIQDIEITQSKYKELFNRRNLGFDAYNTQAVTAGDEFTRTVIEL